MYGSAECNARPIHIAYLFEVVFTQLIYGLDNHPARRKRKLKD